MEEVLVVRVKVKNLTGKDFYVGRRYESLFRGEWVPASGTVIRYPVHNDSKSRLVSECEKVFKGELEFNVSACGIEEV